MQRDDKKRIRHCEYHPNVNHLDISSHWQRLGDPHKTTHSEINKNNFNTKPLTMLSTLVTK